MSPPRHPLAAKVLEIEDSLSGPPGTGEVVVQAKDWNQLVQLASAVALVDAEQAAVVAVVHVLKGATPCCGFSSEPPHLWPAGHRWSRMKKYATCAKCLAVRAAVKP